MTEQEMRELDVWIDEHVMRWVGRGFTPAFTDSPARAMAVLKKCAEKCTVTVEFTPRDSTGKPRFMVARLVSDNDAPQKVVEDLCECAETLELAIAKFAKALYAK